ncbi:hypothetical protein AMTR_s00017p00097660 [Amborella trichopoda]|uniref:Uncharacterized protein n=1 Tax=Amborella trichopoda TaxID=13333 RepID=W1PN07_AMBTC|nr:hypothetical protein AMTR_s00017p00097660 [Amborella trichopoda]
MRINGLRFPKTEEPAKDGRTTKAAIKTFLVQKGSIGVFFLFGWDGRCQVQLKFKFKFKFCPPKSGVRSSSDSNSNSNFVPPKVKFYQVAFRKGGPATPCHFSNSTFLKGEQSSCKRMEDMEASLEVTLAIPSPISSRQEASCGSASTINVVAPAYISSFPTPAISVPSQSALIISAPSTEVDNPMAKRHLAITHDLALGASVDLLCPIEMISTLTSSLSLALVPRNFSCSSGF